MTQIGKTGRVRPHGITDQLVYHIVRCVFRRSRSLIPAASRAAIPAIAITPRV